MQDSSPTVYERRDLHMLVLIIKLSIYCHTDSNTACEKMKKKKTKRNNKHIKKHNKSQELVC